MANTSRTVDIIFGGKDQVSPTIKDIDSSLNTLEAGISNITGPLASAGTKILEIEAALAALAVGGLVLATKSAGGFRDQVAEISTLTSATKEDIGLFSDQILDYSRDSGKSIDDINSAIYQAISLGVDYADSLGALSVAEKLSIGGKAELGSTVELLIGTLNAYGEGVDQATHFSDVFFTTVKLGKTTIPEMANSLAKVTGLAANAQIPIETLSAAFSALTASGLPTEQALVGLRGIISEIISPSKEARDAAAALGAEFSAEALASKGLEGVLWDVQRATGGNVEEIAKLFGNVRGLNAALILGADSSGRFANALDEMRDVSGATEEAYAKMAKNFEIINQRLANNIKATFISVGDPILNVYGDVASSIEALFKSIDIAIDAGSFDVLLSALEDFGTKAGDYIGKVAEALPKALEGIDYSGLIDALKGIGGAMGEFLGGLDLTKPEDLSEGIQNVVNIIEDLTRVSIGIIGIFKQVWDQVKEGIAAFEKMDDSSKESVGNILGAAMVVEKAGLKIAAVLVGLEASGADIEKVFNLVVGSIMFMWNSAQVTFSAAALLITEYIQKMLQVLNIATYGMSDKVKNSIQVIQELQEGMKADIVKQAHETRDAMKIMSQGFDETAKSAGKAKKEIETSSAISQIFGRTWIDIASDLEGVPWSVEKVTEATESATEKAQELGDTTEKIKAIWDEETGSYHLTNISTAAGKAAESVSNMGQAAKETQKVWVDDKGVTHLQILGEAAGKTGAAIRDVGEKDAKVMQAEIETASEEVIAKFNAMADITKTGIEWGAKIDIAQIEADTKAIETMFNSVNTSITSTGTALTELAGIYVSAESQLKQFELEKLLGEENKRRTEAFELQKALTEAQIKMMEQRTLTLKRGDALVTVDGAGLQPHLEAFMFEILAAIQVRVNEEYQEFLLGIGE